MKAVVCHTESHSIPFHPCIFSYKGSLQQVIGLLWGLQLLQYSQTRALLGLLLDILLLPCIMEALQLWTCGTRTSRAPDVQRWDGCWGVQTHSPGSGPGLELSWLACYFSHILTTRVSFLILGQLVHPVLQATRFRARYSSHGWLTQTHTTRANSTMLLRKGARDNWTNILSAENYSSRASSLAPMLLRQALLLSPRIREVAEEWRPTTDWTCPSVLFLIIDLSSNLSSWLWW